MPKPKGKSKAVSKAKDKPVPRVGKSKKEVMQAEMRALKALKKEAQEDKKEPTFSGLSSVKQTGDSITLTRTYRYKGFDGLGALYWELKNEYEKHKNPTIDFDGSTYLFVETADIADSIDPSGDLKGWGTIDDDGEQKEFEAFMVKMPQNPGIQPLLFKAW